MRQMKKSTGTIIILIMIVILLGFGFLSTAIIKDRGVNGVGEDWNLKLGLDLAGGLSITYEVVGDTPTSEQMSDTVYKLQQRIENDLSDESSTTEASVYPVGDRRISVEIPGVKDADRLLEELGTPGQLYFIKDQDSEGNANYSLNSTTGQYELNYTLDELQENGSIILTGTDITSSQAGYNTNQTTNAQSPIVQLRMNDTAAVAFAEATAEAFPRRGTIGIYYDGAFISVPTVNSSIEGGECIIENMESYEAAESLASYIRIGGLDIQLEILQYEIVGAQLGANALDTSLMAGGIGLIIVMLFLIALYMVPGLAASLALMFYTAIMICLIYAFDITLTLPGIAGIVLSIGMAVDANVIIFARIREEIETGKSLRAAVDIGFRKAMSAIIDGNVTTLLAAIVLGLLGSGSVRGFAITLGMGVIISMFTAVVVTRLILKAFMAVGLRNEKSYIRAIRIPHVDFLSKRIICIVVSLCVIAVGFVFMGINAGKGEGALDYSLEFKGGTSTTVDLGADYSLEELENILVPLVSDVTGDNDIQTQKVSGTTSVVIKTRNLSLDERETLNTSIMENFDTQQDQISSESIGATISSEMRQDSIVAVLVAAICMLVYIALRFRDIRFGASAIVTLSHNLLIVLAIYAVARITVGSAFIACMLTIIGYSVNDTIVIFDRIRENIKLKGIKNKEHLKGLINESLNQTVGRSISTSITTAVTVLMILILGVASIREFALPLLCGIIIGTYASIFLAAALWYMMKTASGNIAEGPKKPEKEKKTEKANEENQGILV